MPKGRIAHICWNIGGHQEGISRAVSRLAGLQSREWEVTVFAAQTRPVPGVVVEPVGLNYLERRLPFLLGFAMAASRHLARRRPFDIVHAHVPVLASVDVASVHLYPPRELFDMVRSMLKRTGQLKTAALRRQFRMRRLAEWCYARNMTPATRVIAVSFDLAEQLTRTYGLDHDQITVAPLGVDEQPVPADLSIRRRWGFAPDRPVALFAAHQYTTKGLGFVLQSLALLGRNAPGLVVIGEGSEGSRKSMERMANDLGLADDVRFEGLQDDVAPYLHAADFLVYPTFFDTFGLIITEALAAGKPVITTRAAGVVRELGSIEPLILLDRPDDVLALSSAIALLSADPTVRKALSSAARDALHPLSWQRHADIVRRVYLDLKPHLVEV